jgi:hypothetical protein
VISSLGWLLINWSIRISCSVQRVSARRVGLVPLSLASAVASGHDTRLFAPALGMRRSSPAHQVGHALPPLFGCGRASNARAARSSRRRAQAFTVARVGAHAAARRNATLPDSGLVFPRWMRLSFDTVGSTTARGAREAQSSELGETLGRSARVLHSADVGS